MDKNVKTLGTVHTHTLAFYKQIKKGNISIRLLSNMFFWWANQRAYC